MQPYAESSSSGIGLDTILAPMSVDQFLDRAFGQVPLYLPGETGRFGRLLNWDDLLRLFQSHPMEPPRLNIYVRGSELPGDRYLQRLSDIPRIDAGRLSLLLEGGATAIINHVDDLVPQIGAVADEVADRLAARTGVNLYASWRSEPGFSAHWDTHDVIVLQLAGRKEWSIYKPTRLNPLSGDDFQPPTADEAPDRVEIVGDGDVLYLPRGWIHAPTPLGEPSLHLTISITRPTGAGFFAWLAKELRDNADVRASVPTGNDGTSMTAWRAGIASILREAMNEHIVERFLANEQGKRRARPIFYFPDFGRIEPAEWDASVLIRPSSQHRFVVETEPSGIAQLIVLGRAWPCHAAVAASLARVTSTRPLTLGALENGLSEDHSKQLRQFLAMLMNFGMLAISRD